MEFRPTVIKPHVLMHAIIIILSIIAILGAGLLLLFPPVGLVLGILIFVAVVIFNIYMMSLRLIIIDDKLIKQSLFGSERLDLTKFEKLERMKIIGTVANSPFAIRYIELRVEGETMEISTLLFRWQEVLDVLDIIQNEYGDSSEIADSGH